MKEVIINKAINNIQKYNNYSNTKIKEIKYGLESIYLTTFKIIVIMLINTLIGTIKELLLIFLYHNNINLKWITVIRCIILQYYWKII